MARSNNTWLADLSAEIGRPANDVIRELLETYSTQGAANILNVSHHTLRRHCERVGIELQRYKQSPDRKPHKVGTISARSRIIEAKGEALSVSEWARRTGIARGTIRMRLELGWNGERAITDPPGVSCKRTGCIR